MANRTMASTHHKTRDEAFKKKLITRLRKIEGQIRALETMVEDDTYCPDILIQVNACNKALESFNQELLSDHITHCVKEDLKDGNDESIEELVWILKKLI